jgi:hypothetical protein
MAVPGAPNSVPRRVRRAIRSADGRLKDLPVLLDDGVALGWIGWGVEVWRVDMASLDRRPEAVAQCGDPVRPWLTSREAAT